MRNNIIFDFGGVLLDWNPRYLFREHFNNDTLMEEFLTQVCNNEWNAQMDAGKPFSEGVKELSLKFPQFKTEIEMYHHQWPKMLKGQIDEGVSLLHTLKQNPDFKLYGLTNWSAETFPFAYDHYAFLSELEGIVVSGEEKMNKPDKRIYYTLLERYHLAPENCIFIDDNQANIDMANKIGILGLLWRNNKDEILAQIKQAQQEKEHHHHHHH